MKLTDIPAMISIITAEIQMILMVTAEVLGSILVQEGQKEIIKIVNILRLGTEVIRIEMNVKPEGQVHAKKPHLHTAAAVLHRVETVQEVRPNDCVDTVHRAAGIMLVHAEEGIQVQEEKRAM